MEALKNEIKQTFRALMLRDIVVGILVVITVSVLLYLGHRIESQKEFYRSVAAANYEQQRELVRVLYSRLMVLKIIANELGVTDEKIIAIAGPEAFIVPDFGPPLPLRAE